MSGFPPDLRARSLTALRDATVDILILGGGINGAGIARDLGMRRQQAGTALQVALVERRQFGSGTSGKNSQLIHGGLRYLKYLKFGLVKESLRERAIVRRLAPHMVEPLAFLMPVYGRLDKMKYLMGLSMYDQLAGDQNIAKHREIGKAEILELEPGLNAAGLSGGAIFYDCQINSARFVLENLFDAAAQGVLLANYTQAEPLDRTAEGWRVRLEDLIGGQRIEVRAKKVIDATGAWSKPPGNKPRLVRGSHLILPRLTAEEHAIAYFDKDGRIIFFIPWGSERQFTLLGTTDVDHDGDPDTAQISRQELDYLLGIARQLYPGAPSVTPVATFSSLRALSAGEGSDATSASREHRIFSTPDGILRLQGGKYTTYRAMSEEAVRMVLRESSPWLATQSKTADEPLNGNGERALGRLREELPRVAEQHQIPRAVIEHLIREYGVSIPDVLAMLPSEEVPIPRVHYARMAYAVMHEMCMHLSDFLFVSSYLGYERKWDAAGLEPYAQVMGSWLEWDQARQAREILQVLQSIALPAATPRG